MKAVIWYLFFLWVVSAGATGFWRFSHLLSQQSSDVLTLYVDEFNNSSNGVATLEVCIDGIYKWAKVGYVDTIIINLEAETYNEDIVDREAGIYRIDENNN